MEVLVVAAATLEVSYFQCKCLNLRLFQLLRHHCTSVARLNVVADVAVPSHFLACCAQFG